ncbi:MAG: CBS domain-containing protein [Deltaproteobacteria bacterium]|nr:CBS domain-containing protein [Deltaproteobacteria bacterium]
MSDRPVTIAPDVPVAEAFRVASAFGVQHLVVTEGRFPVGVVCIRCDLGDAFPRRPVSFYMTQIGAYETAERASLQMCEKGVGALIVRGGDSGWGIATRGDLLRAGFHAGEEEGLFFCAACGTHMHVHPVPGCEWVAFCVDCWDRAGPPRVGDDLGESD